MDTTAPEKRHRKQSYAAAGSSEDALRGVMKKLEILAMTYQPAVLSCVKIVQEKVGRASVSSGVSGCSGPVPSYVAEGKEYGAT